MAEKTYDPRNTLDDMAECMDYDPWNELAERRESEYDAVMRHSTNPEKITEFVMAQADEANVSFPEWFAIGYLAAHLASRNQDNS
jgi:hypothetical protein